MGLGVLTALHGISPYVLYLATIVVFVLSIAWKPHAGLVYLVPLLPLQTLRFRLVTAELPLGAYLVDFVLLGVFIGLLVQGKLRIPSGWVGRFTIALVVSTYAWLWWGSLSQRLPMPFWFTDERLSYWKNFAVMPLMFLLTYSAVTTTKMLRILIVLMCISTMLLAKSFRDNVTSEHDYSHFSYGIRGGGAMGYVGAIGLAALEAQVCMFACVMALHIKPKKWKLFFLLAAAASGYCVLFTFSRGAYLSVVVGVAFLAVIYKRILLIPLVIFMLTWSLVLPQAVIERIRMTYNADDTLESSAEQRVTLWEDAMQLIRANPVVGTGFYTYFFMGRDEKLRDTHNLYVKFMLEMGVFGILNLLFLLGAGIVSGWRLYRATKHEFLSALGLGTMLYMIVVAVGNMFGDRWHYIQLGSYMWILLGMTARGLVLCREGQPADLEVGAGNSFSVTPARPEGSLPA